MTKLLHERLTEAVWERLAADVSVGRGMLRSSVEEAVAGVLALHEQERLPAVETNSRGDAIISGLPEGTYDYGVDGKYIVVYGKNVRWRLVADLDNKFTLSRF